MKTHIYNLFDKKRKEKNVMNKASRIRLAKQLLYCARMVLDASCHKQVKIAKSIIAYPSTDIKHLVYRIDKSIIKYIKKFGVRRGFSDSGFVFHHMSYPKNKGVIYSNISNDEIKEIRKAVQIYENDKVKTDKFKEVEAEVKDIVLLPAWFHNKYHQYGKDHWKPMHSRVAYYKKMGEILNSKDIFDPESENYIGDLDFDDTSVHSALQCLERLSITVPKDYKKLVIDLLRKSFNEMLSEIKDYYDHHKF